MAPRIPPGWGQRIIAKSVALAVAFIVVVALLGCWVEKLWRSAFAGLHRFRVVGFKIVGDVCCRLAPEAPVDSRRVLARFSTISGRFPATF